MRPDKSIIDAMKSVRVNASAKLDSRVHSGIDQALAGSQPTTKIHAEPHGRRILMRSASSSQQSVPVAARYRPSGLTPRATPE